MSAFDQAFRIVVGYEGGFDATPDDPGNWTGGRVGAGHLIGTKFGISAASYPGRNIADLTIAEAQTIYREQYWGHIAGDLLPPSVSLAMFDTAVNNGLHRAVSWLQGIVQVEVDGVIGPQTVQSVQAFVQSNGAIALCTELLARRLSYTTRLPTWSLFGLGWARRLCGLAAQCVTISDGAS